jgi:hypothetical protein
MKCSRRRRAARSVDNSFLGALQAGPYKRGGPKRPGSSPHVRGSDSQTLTSPKSQNDSAPNAKVLSSPQADKEQKFYFEDLQAELQHGCAFRLRQAGDVSAVIEMPGGFLLYVAKERTAETLSVPCSPFPNGATSNGSR